MLWKVADRGLAENGSRGSYAGTIDICTYSHEEQMQRMADTLPSFLLYLNASMSCRRKATWVGGIFRLED